MIGALALLAIVIFAVMADRSVARAQRTIADVQFEGRRADAIHDAADHAERTNELFEVLA